MTHAAAGAHLVEGIVDVLERIARRGVAYERMITHDYLERLAEAYARHFHYYDTSPLLMVNTAGVDLVEGRGSFDELIARICGIRRGRHFFNPAGGGLPGPDGG